MPNSDISQFIQLKRLNSIEARQPRPFEKIVTHLYQYNATTSGLTNFLPSPDKKVFAAGVRRMTTPIGIHTKLKTLPRNSY